MNPWLKRLILMSSSWAIPHLPAADIVAGDVSGALGDCFFDEAAIGGSDNETKYLTRAFNGVAADKWKPGQTITLRGIGWAMPLANFTTTQVTATFTDLGPDGIAGGGDDVVLGSVTDKLVYTVKGEYHWLFDKPIVGKITGPILRIQIVSADPVRRKSTDEKGHDQAMVKLSLAGSATDPAPPEP
ncbi:MAG: hypothetical protein ACKO2G_13510 [Verrucomicrobiales bacterium]